MRRDDTSKSVDAFAEFRVALGNQIIEARRETARLVLERAEPASTEQTPEYIELQETAKPHPRNRRELTIDQIRNAGALIVYPFRD